MGELTIRRNRGFAPAQYHKAEQTEKTAASAQNKKTAGATGFQISETLRQLMTKVNQAEHRFRESRRALQTGEGVLDEVQDALSRMEALAQKSAGGSSDRAALQRELDQLRSEVDRMIGSAAVDDTPLFLDAEGEPGGGMETVLRSLSSVLSTLPEDVHTFPDWLTAGLVQEPLTSEQLLTALGLDNTASSLELLAAFINSSPENNPAAARLACLYLGAVIAGGTTDPQEALEGLSRLFETVSQGVEPDRALELLTNGEFSSFAELQSRLADGSAPGLQEFLTRLLLPEGGGTSPLPDIPLFNLLSGMDGMDFASMMNLLSPLQAAAAPSALSTPDAPAPQAAEASVPLLNALPFEGFQVIGQDLSGISFQSASNQLTVETTQHVLIQGTAGNPPSILLLGSGSITLQNVNASKLVASTGEINIFTLGRNSFSEIQLPEGSHLTFGGSGVVRAGLLLSHPSAALRLAGGGMIVEEADGQTGQFPAIPIFLDAPASLAAQNVSVNLPGASAPQPFDILWKTFLPNWSSVSSIEINGQRTKTALLNGDPIRIWLDKGNSGHPVYSLVLQGRDESGRPKTRYAYLHWEQHTRSFQEMSMYPNPFSITGGEEDLDWHYDESSRTLHILSSQVTAVSGGSGTDANQTAFSGRLALADGIGSLELSLNGVICRTGSGRAFDLGRGNNVSLILPDGTDNLFESGAGCAGISLGQGTSLRIVRARGRSGSSYIGTLTASAGMDGAGIGRDSGASRDQNSSILICGGVITARGAGGGAGIGAGKRGAMGSVTITGGTVSSTGGKDGGAGIGAALGAPVGDIRIQGGSITALALCQAAAIGAGVQGHCGNILITGTARIVKAVGGNPGADIGACLFGSCGTVSIAGGADIGRARLRTKSGIPLYMGEITAPLPQFCLSSRSLQLDGLCVLTPEQARSAGTVIQADRQWVAEIQEVYGTLYQQIEQNSLLNVRQYFDPARGAIRNTAAAIALLDNMKQSNLLQPSQAMRTHSSSETVTQLLQ